VGIVAENFQTAHHYKLEMNENNIKRAIQEGIPEYHALILETESFKGTRKQISEQREKIKRLDLLDCFYEHLMLDGVSMSAQMTFTDNCTATTFNFLFFLFIYCSFVFIAIVFSFFKNYVSVF
jgi:hypothetical protein